MMTWLAKVMKKVISPQAVINQYIETCNILKETTPEGDYKRENKEWKKIVKIFKILENNTELANNTLPLLFDNENVVVRSKAAAHCIALNIRVNESKEILEEIAQDERYGIFGFEAEMGLKVWRDRGYLIVYPEQTPRYTGLR
jgi:hypothetical protein